MHSTKYLVSDLILYHAVSLSGCEQMSSGQVQDRRASGQQLMQQPVRVGDWLLPVSLTSRGPLSRATPKSLLVLTGFHAALKIQQQQRSHVRSSMSVGSVALDLRSQSDASIDGACELTLLYVNQADMAWLASVYALKPLGTPTQPSGVVLTGVLLW